MRLSAKQIAKKFDVTVSGVHFWIKNGTIPESMIKRIWTWFKISEDAIIFIENRNKPKANTMDIDSLVEFIFGNICGLSDITWFAVSDIIDVFVDKLKDRV